MSIPRTPEQDNSRRFGSPMMLPDSESSGSSSSPPGFLPEHQVFPQLHRRQNPTLDSGGSLTGKPLPALPGGEHRGSIDPEGSGQHRADNRGPPLAVALGHDTALNLPPGTTAAEERIIRGVAALLRPQPQPRVSIWKLAGMILLLLIIGLIGWMIYRKGFQDGYDAAALGSEDHHPQFTALTWQDLVRDRYNLTAATLSDRLACENDTFMYGIWKSMEGKL
ncbi:hypothetical protein OPT61_g1980 [Boeremia exigua]|uniref:Uncharacterized protein n=1 Tax=Boeremia exigua TaxID=749465 RepID=A0ACC2IND9_9PLEO|nr:hypothetical protein OPT61_g1980 [Boeremia exigua]